MPTNKRLGKGIEALISTYNTEKSDRNINTMINVNDIAPNKNQPRKFFNDKPMEDLINSIREKGIIQPLTVRELSDGSYELISGERRLRAANSLSIKSVPAYILSVNSDVDMLELALIENIQRDNLNPLEEAEGFALLSGKYNLTQKEISKRVGKSRSEVANILRLMKLPVSIRQKLAISINDGGITKGHARALLSLKNNLKMQAIANKIVEKKLSVRQTEKIIKGLSDDSNSKIKIKKNSKDRNIVKMEEKLSQALEAKSQIKSISPSKGFIKISYLSESDLIKIIDKIIK